MFYEFDSTAAKAADTTGGRITEMGKYIGKFTRAEHVTSKKTGTIGIDFDFVTNDGLRARFTIYTRKSDGTTIYGYKQLMTILTCMKQKGLAEPQNIKARVYDFDEGGEVEKVVPQFAELLNKPIGLLIHMEEYRNGEGESKWRPGLSAAFEASTELMASEILELKTTPQKLPKALMAMKDRPLKENGQSGQNGNSYQAAKNGGFQGQELYANQQAQMAALDDLEDDIPF